MSDSSLALDKVRIAHATASANYANYTLAMVTAGVHIFMAFYGLFVFLETPKDRREGRKIYIIISFLLTVMATSAASLDMFRIFKSLMESTGPLSYIDVSAKYGWAVERWASFSCLAVTIIVGDALLIYRCWVIWKKQWLAIVAPVATYISCIGVAVATFIPRRANEIRSTANQRSYNREAIWVFLNVSTITLVTGLISYQLLASRKALARVLPSKDLKLYTGVVAMLIESVLPLSMVGLVYASVLVSNPNSPTVASQVSTNILTFMYYALMGLSPHIIIFRVTTNRSWAHAPPCQASTSEPIQSLRFRPQSRSFYETHDLCQSTLDGTKQGDSQDNLEKKDDHRQSIV